MGAPELIREFEQYKRLYLRYKHQYSKDSNRRREQRVRVFLRFCAQRGVKRIKDIKEEHYRQFVSEVLNSKATETKRKYLLVLKEFFQRAHLPIKVNVQGNIARTKEKKLIKLLQVLDIKLEDLEYEKIQKLLKIL
jgi:site-specific recombinase XerD